MFGSAALDVVFGLIFLYLVLSLICSALNETISSVLAWRADLLREGIGNLLDDTQVTRLARQVYEHSLVQSVTRRKRRRFFRKEAPRYPSYLPSRTFGLALLDVLGATDKKGPELRETIERLDNEQVRRILVLLYDEAEGDARRFRAGVERWFDEGMERVSGWYRRRVQVALWVLALVVAFAVNADSVQLARTLWTDDAVREAVVQQADRAAAGTEVGDVAQEVTDLDELAIPLGWTLDAGEARSVPRDLGGALAKLVGLVVTAAALTFGAPFWFDALRKVAQVRSAGARPSPDPGRGDEKAPA
ncbi:MAG: hypothetical protein M3188_01865 [Actinomycetota bacterium]|nr:hypothetical protein [Actinomycetota bacterium]